MTAHVCWWCGAYGATVEHSCATHDRVNVCARHLEASDPDRLGCFCERCDRLAPELFEASGLFQCAACCATERASCAS